MKWNSNRDYRILRTFSAHDSFKPKIDVNNANIEFNTMATQELHNNK